MARRSYPTDLSEQEWEIVKKIIAKEEPYTTGRHAEVDLREVWKAIFYLNKTGCHWHYLPHDFPPPTTVNYPDLKWIRKGIYQKVNAARRQQLRKMIGRNENPSAGIIDSQSVNGTGESGQQESGFDGGKFVTGRKRHIIVDTLGYLITLVVHAASIADCKGAKRVIAKLVETLDTVKLIGADGSYKGEFIEWVKREFGCVLEVVKKKKKKGFHVLPRRWVVERTFAWLMRFRRLSKDDEKQPSSSEAMGYIASIRLMLRRLCKPTKLAEAA